MIRCQPGSFRIRTSAALAVLALGAGGCEMLAPKPRPELTAVAPALARAGDTVVVQGEGFSTALHENVVLFGNKSGRIITAAPTELHVQVPELGVGSTARVAVRVKVQGRESGALIVDVEPAFTPVETADGSLGVEGEGPAEGEPADGGAEAGEPAPGARRPAAPAPTTSPAGPPPAPAAAPATSESTLTPEADAEQATPVPASQPTPEPKPKAKPPAAKPTPRPVPAVEPTPAPRPADPEGDDRQPAAGAFLTSPTRFVTDSSGDDGPAGFEGAGVEVMDEKKSARLQLDVAPEAMVPGAPYRVRVSLVNLRDDRVRVQSVRATTILATRRSSKTVPLRTKDVEAGATAFLADLPGVWPEEAPEWSLEIVAITKDGEYHATLSWQ